MRDKKYTHIGRFLLRVINVALFIAVWFFFYNKRVFGTHPIQGIIGISLIYYLFYYYLCKIYQAFRFASTSLSEIVFSQVISFGIPDLMLYAGCCLAAHDYVDIVPGVIAVVCQIVCTILICIIIKHVLMKHITSNKTLVISGKMDVDLMTAKEFAERLSYKYKHLYTVEKIVDERESTDVLKQNIDQYETVIFYDVSPAIRNVLISYCMNIEKDFLFSPRIEDIIQRGCTVRHYLDTPLMRYDYNYKNNSYLIIKRVLDVFFALITLIILSPILLITALCIKLEDGGPVFFKQKRATVNGKIFEIIKFRSMVVDADKMGVRPTAENDPRITKVGKVIRATRIDEIPQLLNIIGGSMSFVGPRPERIEHVEMYTKELPEFKERLRVKGGLTGYAQVFGKYNTSAYDKLRLDLLYIENVSLLEDVKIILLTIRTVFQKESTEGFDEKKVQEIYNNTENQQDR